MDASIFFIDGESIIIVPEALALTEHIKKLDAKLLRYVILAHDYVYSPMRKMPLKQRKKMAVRKLWPEIKEDWDPETLETEKAETLRLAIEEYQDLLYDPLRHQLDSIQQKLHMLNEQMIFAEDTKTLKDIKTSIDFLEEKREQVINEIEKDDELNPDVSLTKGLKLSFMEKIKRSKELKLRKKANDEIKV